MGERLFCLLNGYEQCGFRRECCATCSHSIGCQKACPTAVSGRHCPYAVPYAGHSALTKLMDDNPCEEDLAYAERLPQAIISSAIRDFVRAKSGKRMLGESGMAGTPEAVLTEVKLFMQSDYFALLSNAAWQEAPPDGDKLYRMLDDSSIDELNILLKRLERETDETIRN